MTHADFAAAARAAANRRGWSPSTERQALAWLAAASEAEGILAARMAAGAALAAARAGKAPLPVYGGDPPTDVQRKLDRSEWRVGPDGGLRRWNDGGSVVLAGVAGSGDFDGRWVVGDPRLLGFTAEELTAARAAVTAYAAWYAAVYQAAADTATEELRPLSAAFDAADKAAYEAIEAFEPDRWW